MSAKFRPTATCRTRTSPGPGLADLERLPLQDLGATGLVEANAFRHVFLSCVRQGTGPGSVGRCRFRSRCRSRRLGAAAEPTSRMSTTVGRAPECFTEVDKFLILLGQPPRWPRCAHSSGPRPSTATSRSPGPSTSTRPRLMRDVGLDPADLAVPDKWVSAAAVARLLDASAAESGAPRLRAEARRAAPAVHARSAERGAARGARPAQRPQAPAALRAQLQRGPPDAPGRVRRDRHAPAVVRVRRARPGGPGARTGRCGAARHHPRVRRAGLATAGDLLPAPRARGPPDAITGSSARACSSSTTSPVWSSTPATSTPPTRCRTHSCGPTPSCSSTLSSSPRGDELPRSG